MWKQIRGQGLSYRYSLRLNVDEGRLYLSFSYANLLVEAYRQAKIIIVRNNDLFDNFLSLIIQAKTNYLLF